MSNSALLAQIQQGKKLKKVETSDRSAPIVDGTPKSGGASGRGGGVSRGGAPLVPGAGPQLGGLFAGGVPKLKSTGQSSSAKPPELGKPPSIPPASRDTPRGVLTPPATRDAPARSVPTPPPARDAPARTVPALPPARTVPTPARDTPARSTTPARGAPPPPSAPTPPRRPPPPARPVSPPPRPASAGPPVPPRRVPEPPSRSIISQSPALPPRKVPPPPSAAGRAPPPPPPRTASTIKSIPTPAIVSPPSTATLPPPPSRRLPSQALEEPSISRPRAVSTGGLGAALAALRPPPSRSSLAPPAPPAEARGTSQAKRTVSLSGINGTKPPNGTSYSSRIPSPPPSSGPHTFPSSSDFPPPRPFSQGAKKYESGNVRGCTFDVSALG